ncbi:MAG TPA: GNAT family N-acetyltransferase [Acidimicrobiales bacterium]|nr:GNAT family N-acetyltransferase [Acidimicrobiales bacterium]
MLDNPVWHTLVGPRRALAQRRGQAARFDPDVSVFAAVADDPGPEAWDDLAALVGSGQPAAVLRRTVVPPEGWVIEEGGSGVQMVATPAVTPAAGDGPAVESLGPADAGEMSGLIALDPPGPWLPRTVELGGYVGVRDGGRLVAMGGERMRCGGFTEISAVCTHPDHRGRGLATLLTRVIVARIRARGEEAFLHTAGSNDVAIRLYEGLGFRVRASIEYGLLRPVTDATAPAPPREPRRTGHPGSTTTSPPPARRTG